MRLTKSQRRICSLLPLLLWRRGLGRGVASLGSLSKSQIPNPKQISNSKFQIRGSAGSTRALACSDRRPRRSEGNLLTSIWSLAFFWCLAFGIWSFPALTAHAQSQFFLGTADYENTLFAFSSNSIPGITGNPQPTSMAFFNGSVGLVTNSIPYPGTSGDGV